ncbi:MAG: M1 family aminopeptidase [Bacteroidota bacterium]
MNRIILILTVFVFLVSCQKTPKKPNTQSNYSITAKLDTTDLSLDCKMQVDWFNSSDTLISEIPFTFQLDSAKTLIKNIKVNDKAQKFSYALTKTHGFEGFILELLTPISPTEKVSIRIDFKTQPNEYFRERMLFYSEDFPFVQYSENGKFNSYYQVHSDYKVKIIYPTEFNIATTGQIESIDTTNNEITVNTNINSVPTYGFVLLKDVILSEDYSSGILIRSFFFENDEKWGKKLLEHSKNIIEFYVDTLGFYPQPVLTVIPGYPKPYGGWPVCPNVVGIHRGIDLKKERAETHAHWIISHEIGHQYWGFNYVLEPLDYPQWFGIGMGIYTDRLYAVQNIPDFNHSKSFSSSYLQVMKKGYNTTIMQKNDSLDKQNFDWNNSVEHDKSFSVLQMLAYQIGEEDFFKILKYCLENYKGVNVTLEIFKKDCETISERNLDEFFKTWFFTNDYLEYQIDTVITTMNNNQYQNEIKISKIGIANISQVELEINLEGQKRKRLKFDGKKQNESLIFSTEKAITKIILDPDLKLLLVNRKDWNMNN